MEIQSINPATETVNQTFETLTDTETFQICKNARKAFHAWKKIPIAKRCDYLKKLAAVLKSKKNEYGKLITLEMGKPIQQSIAEIEKCAWAADFFAEQAESWLADEIIKTEAKKSFIAYEPLGVILSIMPWNFPFWQLIRFAVPALAAGNVSILRHSNSVPMCAMAIEEAFQLAGFPEHVFKTIITDHPVIKKIIRRNAVDGVSLTGSIAAGKIIGELSGKYIKKFVLELGGSDPFIVLKDADIDTAAAGAVEGRNVNSGQSCVASKRFIVVKEVADEFIQKFIEKMRALKIGDPLDSTVQTGPLANQHQLDLLEDQVKRSVAMGAQIAIGGKKLSSPGYFFEPTVITHVKKNMPVFKEEVFGPVAPVMIVNNEKAAIKLANDSMLGLGSSLWTSDLNNAENVARQIESGLVFINSIVKSDPRLPFGGIKQSGIGRELSRHGMLEFVNIKSIVIS